MQRCATMRGGQRAPLLRGSGAARSITRLAGVGAGAARTSAVVPQLRTASQQRARRMATRAAVEREWHARICRTVCRPRLHAGSQCQLVINASLQAQLVLLRYAARPCQPLRWLNALV